MWSLTEKQTRTLQSIGLALAGTAAVLLAVTILVQIFWIGQPPICGDRIFPPPGYCPKSENGRQETVLKITKTASVRQRRNSGRGHQEKEQVILGSKKDVGICFLTRITGKFDGNGEYAEVRKHENEIWVLSIGSHQNGVAATAVCMKASTVR